MLLDTFNFKGTFHFFLVVLLRCESLGCFVREVTTDFILFSPLCFHSRSNNEMINLGN